MGETMTMLHFDCDYMEGAHPAIIGRLMETNTEQTIGYGFDGYCDRAREKIRQACGNKEAEVFFLVGGTQANATVIDAFLRPWQGVVATEAGHIATHEAGAIEATGHKVIAVPHIDGLIDLDALRGFLGAFTEDPTREHMVQPGLVYISHPTEYGTLYSKESLLALRRICDDFALPLYLDGARLGYGLAAYDTDVSLADIAGLCDAFSIGGTKVGALFGEAVVFPRRTHAAHFFTLMKRHGAVLAKGRLLGLQFDTLFSDGLYLQIARHAIDEALRLKNAFKEKGYRLYIDSPTNQQFVVLENARMAELAKQVGFGFWGLHGQAHTVVRFATSWATKEQDVDALIELI